MRAPSAIWLFPIAFTIHDGEELATMPEWIAAHRADVPWIASLGATRRDIAMAMAVEFIVITGATLLVAWKPRRLFVYTYAALLGIFAVHALTHAAEAILFHGYIPGIISAVTVIPPVSYFIYRQFARARV